MGQERAINDDDDPFNSLDVVNDLVEIFVSYRWNGKEIDFAIKTEEYIDIDLDVSNTQHKLSYQEIIAEVIDCRGEESDKEEEIDENDDSDPIVLCLKDPSQILFRSPTHSSLL